MHARVVDSAQGAWLVVDGRAVLNLCSNDYLGLAGAAELRAAAIHAVELSGVGAGGARSISGTQRLHVELERRLADFKGADQAMLLSSGFLANLAVLPALVGKGDVIFSDELNHASIVDGCRLSGAQIVRYPHADADALRVLLSEHPTSGKRAIVTDGVFSMDGDVAPLDRLAELAQDAGALLVIDDAHGEGVLGRGGRGIVDQFGVREAVTAEIGTLSKAFGVVGGYVCGRGDVMDALRRQARPYLFSTGLSPADTAAALAAIETVVASDQRVQQLWSKTRNFRAALAKHGLDTLGEGPIVPIVLGEEERARAVAEQLFEAGIFVVPIAHPMVARGRARIRVMVSAAHEVADLERAASAIARAVYDSS